MSSVGSAPLLIATVARERGITGVHTHVRQLRGYLDRTGSHVEVLTPHSWASGAHRWKALLLAPLFGARAVLERLWGPAHVWWYRRSHELVLGWVLRRRLAGAGPVVVYAQCPVAARAALSAREGPHQRVVLAVHFRISQADEWADKGQIERDGVVFSGIRSLERSVVSSVDGLVFVSGWARDALCTWLPEARRVPAIVCSNFVDAVDVGPDRTRSGDLVTVGNLERVKNHRYLLRVLSAARELGHNYTLDVYGEGVERRALASLAEQLGVEDLVRLRGFREDVHRRLAGYRAYVHASYSESSSLAIMEAMSVGLPIVSSAEGALSELFDDAVEGRFWPLDDPVAAARILVNLLEDEDLLHRMGRASRRKFDQAYSTDTTAPRLIAFLRDGEAGAA